MDTPEQNAPTRMPANPWHPKVKSYTNLYILLFAILIVVNAVLLTGFQLWFVYKIDGPVSAETVTSLSENYADCTVIDSDTTQYFRGFLLESPEGDRYLVTLEKHFIQDRYRILRKATLELPEEPYSDVVMGDSEGLSLAVENGTITRFNANSLMMSFLYDRVRIPTAYFLYSLLMITLEALLLFGLHKLRKQ